jgi:thiol-disulfide isomerase/thioredoxin
LKRLSIVVLALTVFATPARGADPAPAVRLRQMNDASFSLESLKGSVVVLDFWAPWCVPCRTSFPAMDALQRKYEKQGLRVLGLTLDANDDAIIAFLNAVPVGFTILRDASGQAGEAFNVVVTLLAGGALGGDSGVRVAPSVQATGGVKAWQRGYLADPMMSLDGDTITQVLREHIHASKEGAAGNGGAAGGGCGCN